MVLSSGHTSFRLFVSLLLVLSLVAIVSGQTVADETTDSSLGGQNIVSGNILGPSGVRLERRIHISLSTATRGDRLGMTNENGTFAFRGLVSGNYSIVIDKEKEFEPFSQPFDIIQLRGSPGQTYTLNIRLKAKGRTDAKPGFINPGFANVPKQALGYYNKGVELSRKGDHRGAIEQLKLATTEYPEFMLAFNEMGVEYFRMNEFAKADEAYLSALKIEPEAFAPLMNRGILLFQMQKYSDAELVLRQSIKLKDQPVGHYFLGQALANLGKFDEAEKELMNAVTSGGPEMKEAHRILAIIYGSRGDNKRAIIHLETYLKLAPTARDSNQLRETLVKLKGK